MRISLTGRVFQLFQLKASVAFQSLEPVLASAAHWLFDCLIQEQNLKREKDKKFSPHSNVCGELFPQMLILKIS